MPSTVRPLTSTAAVPRRPEQVGTVVIRPLRPGEEETVQAVFDGLSARSRFLRFHTGLPRLTPAMLRRLADVRDGQHTAYVAVLEGRPVGLVRWLRLATRPTTADVAVEVVDDFHRRGIGLLLLEAAAESAQEAGIEDLVADVSGENRAVRSWLSRHGLRADHADPQHFRVPVAVVVQAGRGIRTA